MSVDQTAAPAATAAARDRNKLRDALTTRITLVLVVYGLLVAVVGGAFLVATAPSPWPMEGSRVSALNHSLQVLNRGGPPLAVQADTAGRPPHRIYRSASNADDPGIFVYAPVVSHFAGLRSGLAAMKWIYAFAFAFTLALFPLLFFTIFDSLLVAVVVPWVLLAVVRYGVGFLDIYWVSAWVVLTVLPILFVLAGRLGRYWLPLAAAAMVAASFATSIRSQAGLGVAISGVALALTRPWGWRRRIASAAVLVIAYISISPIGMGVVTAYRDAQLGRAYTAADTPASHLIWHPAYVGLGYLPNKFGIRFEDGFAINQIRRTDPHAVYPTAHYDAAVRRLFFKTVTKDPGMVISVTARKVLVVIGSSAVAVAFALLGVAMMRLFSAWRPLARRTWLAVPSLLLGVVPCLIGAPYKSYAEGWIGTLAFLCIFVAAWLLVEARAVIGGRRRLGPSLRSRASTMRLRSARTLAVGTATVLIAVSAAVSPSIQASAKRWAAHHVGGAAGVRAHG